MRSLILAAVAAFSPGCGRGSPSAVDAGGQDGGGLDAGPDGGGNDAGPQTTLVGPLPAYIDGNALVSGPHSAAQDATIDPGAVLTVAAGATLTFAPGARLVVHGTLVAVGVSGSVATFTSEAGQGRWGGIFVEQGGQIQIAFAHVTGAGGAASEAAIYLASTAGGGSIADTTIDDSVPGVDVSAGATVQRLVVHNANPPWNGPVTIRGGAASFTNLTVDQGTTGVDAIVVYGGGPQLSHVTVRNHHCCVHITQSTQARVDAMDCDTSDVYGFMFYSSTGMTGTGSNITCGASADAYAGNGPIDLRGNYWGGGAATIGGGQASIVDASSYATSPIAGAGAQ